MKWRRRTLLLILKTQYKHNRNDYSRCSQLDLKNSKFLGWGAPTFFLLWL